MSSIGQRIFELRTARVPRLTQRELAERAGVSVDLIAKLEQGRKQSAKIITLTAIADVLDVDLSALVGRSTRPESAPTPPAASAQRAAERLPTETIPVDESEEMRRRTFVAMTGTVMVDAVSSFDTGLASARTPFLARIIDRLSGAMFPSPATDKLGITSSRAGLTAAVHRAWQLRQAAKYDSLAQLLASLIGDVEHGLVEASSDREQQDALKLAVHTYNAASSLFKKLGESQLALVAADRALRSARPLGDPLLSASAAYRLANVLLPAHRLDETQRVALQAASTIEPGIMQTRRSLATWGGLLLTAAVAAARKGDGSTAWGILGEARTAARLVGADHADIYAVFGPTNVAIHGVQIAVELGDGKNATRRGVQINADTLPASLVERRAQFLIDMAHGYFLQDHGTKAVATLLRAETIAPQEVHLSTDVHKIAQALLMGRHGVNGELRDFADRIGRKCQIAM